MMQCFNVKQQFFFGKISSFPPYYFCPFFLGWTEGGSYMITEKVTVCDVENVQTSRVRFAVGPLVYRMITSHYKAAIVGLMLKWYQICFANFLLLCVLVNYLSDNAFLHQSTTRIRVKSVAVVNM